MLTLVYKRLENGDYQDTSGKIIKDKNELYKSIGTTLPGGIYVKIDMEGNIYIDMELLGSISDKEYLELLDSKKKCQILN